MSPISKTTLVDWQATQAKDSEFAAAEQELEAGYQVARLRILRGLTQAQLAERVGTRQPSIARLESGQSFPSVSFLKRIANALGANMEIRIVPQDEIWAQVEATASVSIAEGKAKYKTRQKNKRPSLMDETSPNVPGLDHGKVSLQPGFDEHLPEFDL